MTTPKKALIFVYGTLKRGHKNHYKMYQAEYIGRAVIFGYSMYKLPAGFPGIVVDKRGSVDGELYWLDTNQLPALDEFEGVPHLYNRATQVITLANGTIATAQFYVYQKAIDDYERITTSPARWTKEME